MTAKDRPVSKPATDDYRAGYDAIFGNDGDPWLCEECGEEIDHEGLCDYCQTEADDEDDDTCGHCAGTGEGMHDGSRCIVCGGKGYVRNFDPDDYDPPEDR